MDDTVIRPIRPAPHIVDVLDEIPLQTKSLIDVGCGKGVLGALMRIYRPRCERVVGVDIYEPYLDFCIANNFYDEVYKHDLQNVPLPFRDKEFEVSTCVEVIEHLDKKYGFSLIHELERITKNRLIMTTPNIWWGKQKNIRYDNPYGWHRSRWYVTDFKKLGFDVKGVRKLNLESKAMSFPIQTLRPFLSLLAKSMSGLACFFPTTSLFIITIKDFE